MCVHLSSMPLQQNAMLANTMSRQQAEENTISGAKTLPAQHKTMVVQQKRCSRNNVLQHIMQVARYTFQAMGLEIFGARVQWQFAASVYENPMHAQECNAYQQIYQ